MGVVEALVEGANWHREAVLGPKCTGVSLTVAISTLVINPVGVTTASVRIRRK